MRRSNTAFAMAEQRQRSIPTIDLEKRIMRALESSTKGQRWLGLLPQVGMAAALVVLAALLAFWLSRSPILNHVAPAVTTKPSPLATRPSPKARIVGTSLTARYSASLGYEGATGDLLLFGGFTTDPPYGTVNDTWTWNGQSWQLRDIDHAPAPRTDASMVYDAAAKQLLLFGGVELTPAGASKAAVTGSQASAGGGPVNDTWTWGDGSWLELHPATAPSERFGALMAYDATRRQVVLFGGSGPAGHGLPFDDTWTWDGSTWTPQHPAHKPPGWTARAMVYDDSLNQILLFASFGCSAGSQGFCQTWQTWSWDGSNWFLRSTGNLSTETGYGVKVAYDAQRNAVVLFGGQIQGGRGPNSYFSETWIWTLSGGWRRQTPSSSPPQVDYSLAAMAFDYRTGVVVLFQPENGFWSWDGKAWSKLGP